MCTPLRGFSGVPPAHLQGGPRSSPEAKNKGDALAGARGAGSPGAAAAPPPLLRGQRPPLPRRPAPLGGAKWRPRHKMAAGHGHERVLAETKQAPWSPSPGAAMPARDAPWWWPPPARRTVPAARPSSAFPHQPLQFAGQRALPFLFQIPPCPGGACEQDKTVRNWAQNLPSRRKRRASLGSPQSQLQVTKEDRKGGHQTIYPS